MRENSLMAGVSVHVMSWQEWPGFAPMWERVHLADPEASFFLTREWMDCWLATFGPDLEPQLLRFEEHGEVVGCVLLVWRIRWSRGIPLRRVYLNCSGEDEADTTYIEYNSVLSLPSHRDPVAAALAAYIRGRTWDELHLAGMADGAAIHALRGTARINETAEQPSYYVDFRQLRRNDADYDSALSPGARQQIRRCRRLYEETLGPCTLEVASSREHGRQFFADLVSLHRTAWRNRGRRSTFDSGRLTEFHRRLIESSFERGRIFLARVWAGPEIIGVLYGFLYRGRLYFCQSGFRYASDGRLKPGLLSHYLAIRHCMEQPHLGEYDFLAGDEQYKRSLATTCRPMRWITVRRPTVRTFFFSGFGRVKWTYEQTVRRRDSGDRQARGDELAGNVPLP